MVFAGRRPMMKKIKIKIKSLIPARIQGSGRTFWAVFSFHFLINGSLLVAEASPRCVDLFDTSPRKTAKPIGMAAMKTMVGRFLSIRDYTLTDWDLSQLTEKIAISQFKEEEYKMVHYPFLGEAINQFHWDQLKNLSLKKMI